MPFTALATTVATYVPHVIAAGTLVFGFLPGYLNEEGFDDGQGRYAVLGLVLPPTVRKPAALLLGVALVILALWRADPDRPQDSAVWLFGGALLIGTPGYPWYCLPLVVLAVWPTALSGSPSPCRLRGLRALPGAASARPCVRPGRSGGPGRLAGQGGSSVRHVVDVSRRDARSLTGLFVGPVLLLTTCWFQGTSLFDARHRCYDSPQEGALPAHPLIVDSASIHPIGVEGDVVQERRESEGRRGVVPRTSVSDPPLRAHDVVVGRPAFELAQAAPRAGCNAPTRTSTRSV